MTNAPMNATEWLARLVGFDTTSAKTNLPLIEDVAGYLDDLGASVRLIRDDGGTKANLFATIGPERAGGIVLSGHSDVVPVAGQPWDTDPFVMSERDGRFYGRGTTDMKGFIACALALAPETVSQVAEIPIHIALSYDEEVGCLGVRSMIEAIGRELPRPRLAIVGEPTEMRVANAHKGISQQTTVVTGRDGHSSRPGSGVNAVAYGAQIIGFLDRLATEYGEHASGASRFDPPGTTFNVGVITGGTAVNIIARECSFRWEFRPTPDVDPAEILARLNDFVEAEILPRMRAVDPAAGVTTTVEISAPTLEVTAGSPAEEFALGLTGENAAVAMSYVCEAGLFSCAGIPSVICGPGSIAEAHQPNEFVTLDQLEACTAFLERLLASSSSAA
jgi:acetylornithine deacetylase